MFFSKGEKQVGARQRDRKSFIKRLKPRDRQREVYVRLKEMQQSRRKEKDEVKPPIKAKWIV